MKTTLFGGPFTPAVSNPSTGSRILFGDTPPKDTVDIQDTQSKESQKKKKDGPGALGTSVSWFFKSIIPCGFLGTVLLLLAPLTATITLPMAIGAFFLPLLAGLLGFIRGSARG